jgi:UDP-arabinose 4-epimerase
MPVTYDSLVTGHEWAVKWGPLERGDLLDRARLDQVIAQYRPAAIMHFAAFAFVGESVTQPGKYYRNNVVGSLTLLEAARDHGIGQFVFSSTCATYGIPEATPILEHTPQRPINPYGASKLVVERMLADFGAVHDLRSIVLRYFNAAGADLDGEIGEDHDPETHLIPIVLDVAAGRRESVTIFGNDYDTPDGTCVRDYVHVNDLANAHVKALGRLRQGAASHVFNLGNGRGFSVRQVIDSAKRVTSLPIAARIGNRRAGDPATLISDARKASAELGWKPHIADLDQIIGSAWFWHRRSARAAAANNAVHA